ncbi:Sec-independent protein translocase protein TatB [Rhizobium sp. NTR19]|uniref:Sec-independent protein translocase protein TatB n=1 Tax=Neorhizobium turbinariae TaxID=2937795 RepID=A0ABT0ISS9_9HYPH|nr:Sec-independent protein translocase protein TatB [Neorhizobium turbinariae]MCK8780936.1 Sec-independent protein translocase protein TatB [Neorhizobium turbinariae]
MLDIGWSELLVIAIILIVVVGPKDLPPMLRAFGKMTANLRKMAGEFRTQFDEALREADLDEVKSTLTDVQKLNPTNALRDAINPLRQMGQEIKSDLQRATQLPSQTTAEPAKSADAIGSGETVSAATDETPVVASDTQSAATQTSPVSAAPVASAAPAGVAGEAAAKPVRKTSARAKPQADAADIASADAKPARRRVAKPAAKPAAITGDGEPVKAASRKRTVKKTDTPKDDA